MITRRIINPRTIMKMIRNKNKSDQPVSVDKIAARSMADRSVFVLSLKLWDKCINDQGKLTRSYLSSDNCNVEYMQVPNSSTASSILQIKQRVCST